MRLKFVYPVTPAQNPMLAEEVIVPNYFSLDAIHTIA
jgi:hypothetical protein